MSADTRGIRELAKGFLLERGATNVLGFWTFINPLEWDQVLTTFAESIVEQCAQIADTFPAAKNDEELWTPVNERIALAIRSRWQRGEG